MPHVSADRPCALAGDTRGAVARHPWLPVLAGTPRRPAARSASGRAAAAAAEVQGQWGQGWWRRGRHTSWLMRMLLLLLAGSGLEYVLLALTGPLFLGALAIYHKRRRLRQNALAGGTLPAAQAATPTAEAAATPWCQASAWGWDSLCWTRPCSAPRMEHGTSTARWSPEHWALLREQPRGTAQPGGKRDPSSPPEPCAALLQGSQLYAVIDAVPVRRWKEFMRVLELREAEIELVELEVAHIRDQQYEMLKRWCQQTSATLDRVFAALEHMDLGGCAEALRRSLPAGP